MANKNTEMPFIGISKKAENQELVPHAEQALEFVQEMISEGNHIDWDMSEFETVSEMISTDDGLQGALKKVTYDVYQGREAVPLVYKSLYNETTDANYPKLIEENFQGPVQVVFVKIAEGQQVRFGRLAEGETQTVKFYTYAAGIEITEDMVEYNETWNITEASTAMGEAYNKVLNHMHMSPIISESYTTTGGGLAAQKKAQNDGTPQEIAFDTDIETTLQNAIKVLPQGSKMVINSFDRTRVEQALAGAMYEDLSPNAVKRKFSLDDIVEYDGDEVVVGDKTYEYAGVTEGEAYLVTPQRQFRERIKHDLRLSQLAENPRFLTAGGTVGRARRAVSAALGGKYGGIKLNLE